MQNSDAQKKVSATPQILCESEYRARCLGVQEQLALLGCGTRIEHTEGTGWGARTSIYNRVSGAEITYNPEDHPVLETIIALDNARKVTCPTCGKKSGVKISTVSRGISTGIFGLASGKLGKTFKCRNCGYTW